MGMLWAEGLPANPKESFPKNDPIWDKVGLRQLCDAVHGDSCIANCDLVTKGIMHMPPPMYKELVRDLQAHVGKLEDWLMAPIEDF